MVDVVDELVDRLWSMLIRKRLSHLHPAGEERRVSSRQLVPQLDREVDGADGCDALVLDLTAAALGLPPVALLDFTRVAVKRKPRRAAAGLLDLHEKLAAAGDGPVDAELELRHPTPNVVVSFVGVIRPSRNLKAVLLQRGLIRGLTGSCFHRGTGDNKTCKGDR